MTCLELYSKIGLAQLGRNLVTKSIGREVAQDQLPRELPSLLSPFALLSLHQATVLTPPFPWLVWCWPGIRAIAGERGTLKLVQPLPLPENSAGEPDHHFGWGTAADF